MLLPHATPTSPGVWRRPMRRSSRRAVLRSYRPSLTASSLPTDNFCSWRVVRNKKSDITRVVLTLCCRNAGVGARLRPRVCRQQGTAPSHYRGAPISSRLVLSSPLQSIATLLLPLFLTTPQVSPGDRRITLAKVVAQLLSLSVFACATQQHFVPSHSSTARPPS
jgi:hypothetical protein